MDQSAPAISIGTKKQLVTRSFLTLLTSEYSLLSCQPSCRWTQAFIQSHAFSGQHMLSTMEGMRDPGLAPQEPTSGQRRQNDYHVCGMGLCDGAC